MTINRQLKRYFRFSLWFRIFLIILMLEVLHGLYSFKSNFQRSSVETRIFMNTSNENLSMPELFRRNVSLASEGSWQNVGGIKDFKFLVYSAFLDIRRDRMVRVIAVTKTKNPHPKVWCKLWFKEGYRNTTIEGKLSIIKEHWGLAYSAYYIICPLEKNHLVPEAVSLLSGPDQEAENFLKVIATYNNIKAWNAFDLPTVVNKMAVCVKPLHYEFNKVIELLEFIELHQIMGVDHFFLYNHTVSPQVSCLLEKYQREGIVTVLPWQLPIESQKQIRTEGIFASLNDCLYRTMLQYSHAIFVDFDEYIIPRNNYSYKDLFEHLENQNYPNRFASFSFKNCFFYRQWPDDSDVKSFNDPIAEQLIVLRKTTRKTEFHNHRTRSKYIVRPELVTMVGNHFIWEYYDKKEFGNMDVNTNDAFLHHYRICEFGGDNCIVQPSTVDKTAYRYRDELIKAVKKRYNVSLNDCRLDTLNDRG